MCPLEKIHLPAESSGKAIPLGTRFLKGRVYKFVISGTVKSEYDSPTEGSDESWSRDAFYHLSCRRGGKPCAGGHYPDATNGLLARDQSRKEFGFSGVQYMAEGGGRNPDYQRGHKYTLFLDSIKGDAELMMCCFPIEPRYTHKGGFDVAIYGPQAASHEVSYSISQLGEPSPPDQPTMFRTKTEGRGKVFFSHAPKGGGRKSRGSASGLIRHNDEFLTPNGDTPHSKMQLRITHATYVKTGPFTRVLRLSGFVVNSEAEGTWAAEVGEAVYVDLYDDATNENDLVEWHVRCNRQAEEGFEDCGDDHRYADGPENKLLVKISAPKKT